MEFFTVVFCEHTAQKKHCISFTATRRPEIYAAFAVAQRFFVFFQACEHFICRKILRIAANDNFFFVAVIRIKHKIPQNRNNTVFGKYALYHGK